MSCDKISYENYKEAQAAIRGIVVHSKHTKKMRVYKCDACKGFHITTSIKSGTLRKSKDFKYPVKIPAKGFKIKIPEIKPKKFTRSGNELATYKLGDAYNLKLKGA